MKITQENFVLSVETISPVVISIPHDGLQKEGLLSAFKQRAKGVMGREQHVSTIANDVNRYAPVASIVRGLLPRAVCDYNRPEEGVEDVAYVDEGVGMYYRAYHEQIASLLQRARAQYGKARLIDLHGYTGPTAGLVLGSRNGSTCRDGYDRRALEFLENYEHCGVFAHIARVGERFSGGHTVARHASEKVSALQIEIDSWYRDNDAQERGRVLSAILSQLIEEVR